jgi:hypothetical protein
LEKSILDFLLSLNIHEIPSLLVVCPQVASGISYTTKVEAEEPRLVLEMMVVYGGHIWGRHYGLVVGGHYGLVVGEHYGLVVGGHYGLLVVEALVVAE